jgi:hypothetical protein
MLSNTKFGKFVLLVSLASLTACGTTRYSPTAEQLSEFKPNCSIARQQIEWLNSLRTTSDERLGSRAQTKMFGILTSDYQHRVDQGNGLTDWWVNTNIKEVYNKCAV